METILPTVWFFLLGLILMLYVVLDGTDLGIGALCLWANKRDRSAMMTSMGPLWYANETWLVIAGAVLFGTFPLAYGIILSSLYLPVMLMLFGLILRAVSIEFRGHSERKQFWEIVFASGSLMAILGQGFIMGGLLSGIKIQNSQFAGGPLDWLNGTSIAIAAGIVAAYSMIGASTLSGKLEPDAQVSNRRLLKINASAALGLFILAILLLLATTPMTSSWLQPTRLYLMSFFLLAAMVGFAMLLRSSTTRNTSGKPFVWSIVVFLSAASAAVAGIFPFFIPFSLSIASAAAPEPTLVFMLFGVGTVLPIIVVYNLYVRRVFSRKEYSDTPKDSY